jgi:signal transduction histidine kinase
MTRVLIVDDEPHNLCTLEALLAPDGYELHLAEHSEDGWRQACELRPDVILLDVMLPGLDGFEFCRRIRASDTLREVAVILVTALDDQRARLRGLESGADDFLTKPVDKQELRARLRTVASLNRYRQIAQQRERFERLFQMVPAGILLLDPAGLVVGLNPRALDLLGRGTRAELEGQMIEQCFDPASMRRLACLLGRVALAPDGQMPPPIQLERQHGFQVLSARASRLAENPESLTLLVLDDITAEVRARVELQDFNRRLEEQVRVRTQELEQANGLLLSYASFVSHDLRSPLSVLKGYLSMMDGGHVEVGETAAPMISSCLQAACAMEELINNILQLSRGEIGPSSPHAPVDPAPIIHRVIHHVRGWSQSKSPARIEVGPLPPVAAHPLLIERVFHNVIGNAVKYTAHRAEPVIEISGRLDAAGPVISVRDNGAGFDERQSDRLFEEFSRLATAEGTEGLGLGLSLVARLLRAHHGRIWAEGTPGKGATFHVQFGVGGESGVSAA